MDFLAQQLRAAAPKWQQSGIIHPEVGMIAVASYLLDAGVPVDILSAPLHLGNFMGDQAPREHTVLALGVAGHVIGSLGEQTWADILAATRQENCLWKECWFTDKASEIELLQSWPAESGAIHEMRSDIHTRCQQAGATIVAAWRRHQLDAHTPCAPGAGSAKPRI